MALSTVAQDDFLLSKIKEATPLIPILPLSAKKPWISSHTLHLIHVFQNTTFTDTRALKACRNAIKKSARRDKKLFIAQNLQDDFHGSSVHARATN